MTPPLPSSLTRSSTVPAPLSHAENVYCDSSITWYRMKKPSFVRLPGVVTRIDETPNAGSDVSYVKDVPSPLRLSPARCTPRSTLRLVGVANGVLSAGVVGSEVGVGVEALVVGGVGDGAEVRVAVGVGASVAVGVGSCAVHDKSNPRNATEPRKPIVIPNLACRGGSFAD